jgi:hypothetical protein
MIRTSLLLAFTLLASFNPLVLAAPTQPLWNAVATPQFGTPGDCFGPCVVPACPSTHFHICRGDPGFTRIVFHGGGASQDITVKNGTSGMQGALGINIQPKPGFTWGSVEACEDILGACVT